jgi:hypothetical protein
MDCFCKELELERKTEKTADAFMPMMRWHFKRIGEVGFAITHCPTCGKDIRLDDLKLMSGQ